MSKHTPGPWSAINYHGDRWWINAEILTGDSRIAYLGHEATEKDASLIAAAPDLLAAAKAVVEIWDNSGDYIHPKSLMASDLRHAIRKAEGGE